MHFCSNMYNDRKVDIPYSLYESVQGKYFEAYSSDLIYGNGTSAWASLVNPINSGVNFYLGLFAINDLLKPPIDVEIWFNAQLPGNEVNSTNITPGDTALYPSPVPAVKLLSASKVKGSPVGGVNAFSRKSMPGQSLTVLEDGKFIFPPGGSFTIFLTNTSNVETPGIVRVNFGWWEESVRYY
ncbi:MAG: DUF6143 family protein [Bacillota bacterium]|nr:DUF6143 family protein [Bacillota bacterium]